MSNTKKTKIQLAFEHIASEYVEMRTVVRNGEQQKLNVLAWQQRSALNSLVNSFGYQLEFAETSLDRARDRVRDAMRTDKGGEIDERNLNRAVEWAERMEMQVAVANNVFVAAQEAFEVIFEEKYQPFKSAPAGASPKAGQSTVSDTLNRAARLLGETVTEELNGIEDATS